MPNVLVRDVPEHELDELKAAAAARDMSLQSYLLDVVHAQTTYLRRQAALNRIDERLHGKPAVNTQDRQAVLDSIGTAHAERADQLVEPTR